MARNDDSTTFTLVFKKGLAERNRLPIEQVIKTLQEFQEMVREVGKQVQRRNGVERPDGDFGIELLASATGLVFRKGSLKANAAPTRDLVNAQETLHLIVDNVRSYAKPAVAVPDAEEATIARRMTRIGELQREARTELAVQVKTKEHRLQTATLTERAIVNLETMNAPQMKIAGLDLYGRLRQLNDRSRDDEGGEYFWGELVTDTDEIWRLRFKVGNLDDVLPLFRHQVYVAGNATYFGAANPRLEVHDIRPDADRDYLAAFDVMRGLGHDLFGDADGDELLQAMKG